MARPYYWMHFEYCNFVIVLLKIVNFKSIQAGAQELKCQYLIQGLLFENCFTRLYDEGNNGRFGREPEIVSVGVIVCSREEE